MHPTAVDPQLSEPKLANPNTIFCNYNDIHWNFAVDKEIKTPFKMTYFEYPNISNIQTTLGPEVFG